MKNVFFSCATNSKNPRGLPQLPLSEQKEDPYDIYVDVFAEISGKLKWNDNFHVPWIQTLLVFIFCIL